MDSASEEPRLGEEKDKDDEEEGEDGNDEGERALRLGVEARLEDEARGEKMERRGSLIRRVRMGAIANILQLHNVVQEKRGMDMVKGS